MIGRLLNGRYQVQNQLLGYGGIGVVYRALDTETDEPVAVKHLAPHQRQKQHAALEKEIALLQRLDHPAILQYRDQGIAPPETPDPDAAAPPPDDRFMVVELCPGGSLWRYINEQRPQLPLDHILQWMAHLADAVAALHAVQIAHGDLRPPNVLLRTAEPLQTADPAMPVVVLADFSHAVEAATDADRRQDVAQLRQLLRDLLGGGQFTDPQSHPALSPALHQALAAEVQTAAALHVRLQGVLAHLQQQTPASAAAMPTLTPTATLHYPLTQHALPERGTGFAFQNQWAAQPALTAAADPPYRIDVAHPERPFFSRPIQLGDSKQLTIGRAPESDIRLVDADVSYHHALVQATPDGWEVVDLASFNGVTMRSGETWQRLPANRPVAWPGETPLRIGATVLRWVGHAEPDVRQQFMTSGARLPAVKAAEVDWGIQLTVTPVQQTIMPGESAVYTVTLQNESDTITNLTLHLLGVDAAWATFDDPVVKLLQAETADRTLTITPPADHTAAAGEYVCTLEAQKARAGQVTALLAFTIPPVTALTAAVAPPLLPRKGTAQLSLHNQSNVRQDLHAHLLPTEMVRLTLDAPQPLSLGPGAAVSLPLHVRPSRRHWSLVEQPAAFTVQVFPDDAPDQVVEAPGTLMLKPLMSPIVLSVLLLVGALLVMFWISNRQIVRQNEVLAQALNPGEPATAAGAGGAGGGIGGGSAAANAAGAQDGAEAEATGGVQGVINRVAAAVPALNNLLPPTPLAPNLPPQFVSAPPVEIAEAAAYQYDIVAENGEADDAVQIFPGQPLPDWLTLVDNGDGTAVLSGTPDDAQVGDHLVTLRVQDSISQSDEQTFVLTVTNVNDPPAIRPFTLSGFEDQPLRIFPDVFLAHYDDPDPTPQLARVTFVQVPADGALLLDGAPLAEGEEVDFPALINGELRYEPAPGWFGKTTFAWNGFDGELMGVAAATVQIEMAPVNDAPTFSVDGPMLTLPEDSGPTTIAGWARNIWPGAENEATQTLTFTVAVTPVLGVSAAETVTLLSDPVIDPATGDLSLETAANEYGVLNLLVTLVDDGGDANGGVARTGPVTVTLQVASINDAPELECANNRLGDMDEDGSPGDGFLVGIHFVPVLDAATENHLCPKVSDVDTLSVNTDRQGNRILEPDRIGIAVYFVGDAPEAGEWQYKRGSTGLWLPFSQALAADTAVLLRPIDAIRFAPAPDYGGPAPELFFRAWDQSSSDSNAAANGGSTAFSSNAGFASLFVNPVNDPPLVMTQTLTQSLTNWTGVAFLVDSTGAEDIDSESLGIAITEVSGGNWEYDTDGDNQKNGDLTTPANSDDAHHLPAAAQIRCNTSPAANCGSIKFYVWDGSNGVNTGDAVRMKGRAQSDSAYSTVLVTANHE